MRSNATTASQPRPIATPADIYRQAFAQGLEPEPELTVDAWADQYRILTGETAAEHGRWRTDRTPYLREIMRCLSSCDPCKEVIFMKPSQVGGSECGNNWIGYIIDCAPGPMLMVQPTVETAKRYSHQRLAPLFEDTPKLQGRVAEHKNRDKNNTTLFKRFLGGVLVVTGSNSAAGLKSMPIRYLFLDEVDEYPEDVDEQGDPAQLAIKRTTAFANRKIFKASTPSIKDASRIEAAYEHSDKRRYHLPCPHCGALQWLKWAQIKWEKEDPSVVWYECEAQGCRIEEHDKTFMLEAGRWIHERPGQGAPGFHLNALYTAVGLGLSWVEIVDEFLKAKGNPEKLKVWTNSVLAETWTPVDKVDDQPLYNRREGYGPQLPEQVVYVTVGVDIQEDRIEAEAVGWGPGEESWGLDYQVFYGLTAQDDVFNRLDAWLSQTWEHPTGAILRTSIACIDSGHQTSQVYKFVRTRQMRGVFATKGIGEDGRPLISRPSSQAGGVRLFTIGTNTAKEVVYGRLKLQELGPGYMHFPLSYNLDYFKQLTAENLVKTFRMGRERRLWVKTQMRNEALDCRIGATAALAIANVNLELLAQRMRPKEEEQHTKPRMPRKPGFVKRWRE